MRDIASAVGIEAASLYSHINSKEDILSDICFSLADAFHEALNQAETKSESIEDELKEAISAHIKILCSRYQMAGVYLVEWRHLSEPNLSRFVEKRKAYEATFVEILNKGVAKSVFDISDTNFSAKLILSSLNGLIQWYQPDGKYTPNLLAEMYYNQLIKGIKTK